MCWTHAIENECEDPHKKLGVKVKKEPMKKKEKPAAMKKEHVERVERVRQKKSNNLDSDTQKEHDEEDLHEGTEFDEPQVKKEPKTKLKPNLRKMEVEKNSNTKAERQWPKGVRICLGSLPLQRIPTRERCQGGNSQARATQQNCARVASLTRTCQSVNGCGHIFCDECY